MLVLLILTSSLLYFLGLYLFFLSQKTTQTVTGRAAHTRSETRDLNSPSMISRPEEAAHCF